MDGDEHHTGSRITTAFRLRAWWLRTFRGYRLESKRRMPKQSIFGEFYYKNHWVLRKRDEK